MTTNERSSHNDEIRRVPLGLGWLNWRGVVGWLGRQEMKAGRLGLTILKGQASKVAARSLNAGLPFLFTISNLKHTAFFAIFKKYIEIAQKGLRK